MIVIAIPQVTKGKRSDIIALCAYLLLSFLKFLSKTGWSEQRILRLLQSNLFSKKDLLTLIRPSPPADYSCPPQLALWA